MRAERIDSREIASESLPARKPPGAERRRYPRKKLPQGSLLAQVESQEDRRLVLGRADDLSLGGLRVKTPEMLSVGEPVVVRFFIPPDRHPIEAPGRVVRTEAGRSMAIAFLGLPEALRRRIEGYLGAVPQPARGKAPTRAIAQRRPRDRRSGRVTRHLPVALNWLSGQGLPRQEVAETQLLSQHGALLLTFAELEPGQVVRLSMPDTRRDTTARVVSATPGAAGRMEVAVEFMATANFWQLEFPPAARARPTRNRRRSARRAERLGVDLCWVDEWARPRQEAALVRNLSRHGALLMARLSFPVGQEICLRVPALSREAVARVVWAGHSEIPAWTNLGIEFLETENFWGPLLPPELQSPSA